MFKRKPREKTTGVYIDLSLASDYAYNTSDGGQTAWVAAWGSKKPNVGDYLLIPRKKGQHDDMARYKVLDVDYCYNVDPPNMFTAGLRHAPSDRP